MKEKKYVSPSVSERASRIRTSILAGSNPVAVDPIKGNDVGFVDARVRNNVDNRDNVSVLNF